MGSSRVRGAHAQRASRPTTRSSGVLVPLKPNRAHTRPCGTYPRGHPKSTALQARTRSAWRRTRFRGRGPGRFPYAGLHNAPRPIPGLTDAPRSARIVCGSRLRRESRDEREGAILMRWSLRRQGIRIALGLGATIAVACSVPEVTGINPDAGGNAGTAGTAGSGGIAGSAGTGGGGGAGAAAGTSGSGGTKDDASTKPDGAAGTGGAGGAAGQAGAAGTAGAGGQAGSGPAATCVTSGGTVTKATCCTVVQDFPNMCSAGACGCSPASSHDVQICSCAGGKCFDGTVCK